MTLAQDWDFRDLTHWQWSEKFDGCRAYWDGQALWTRGGNVILAPSSFIESLPAGIALDGEIWAGRGGYIEAMNAVRHGIFTDRITFQCFDCPGASGDWISRMKQAEKFQNRIVRTCDRGVIKSRDEASERAAKIIEQGGEGLMLRSPNVFEYQRKRTNTLQRIKAKNLYAPWHGAKPQFKFRKFGGLDFSQMPFDPEIEYKIASHLA